MRIERLFLILLPLLAIVALSSRAQQTPARRVTYECDNGRTFQVEYATNSARLTFNSGDSFILPQVVTASGARYSNGQITLFTRGNEAFIEENGQQTYSNCLVQASSLPPASPSPTPSPTPTPTPIPTPTPTVRPTTLPAPIPTPTPTTPPVQGLW